MDKKKVIFVCIHNSARSQMAEAYLLQFAEDIFDVDSAGLEPGTLNPIVVEAMKLDGIDISQNTTKSVFDMHKKGLLYDIVITVCDETSGEKCPLFPSKNGNAKRLHWGFEDPSGLDGGHNKKLAATVKIRDEIKAKIRAFVDGYR